MLELNTTAEEGAVVLSDDGLTIYYASGSGRATGVSVWTATRTSLGSAFTDPHVMADLTALGLQSEAISAVPGWLSPDRCRLYLSTTRDGKADIYMAWRR